MKTKTPVSWVLFNAVLGGTGGWLLAWGPLNYQVIGQGLAVALGAALAAWVSSVNQKPVLSGFARYVELMRQGMRWVIGVFVVGIVITCTVQLYQIGIFPPVDLNQVRAYDRLCRAISANYPYSAIKMIAPQEICQRYRPAVQAAQSDEQYFRVVDAMLLAFGDSHTYLKSPQLDSRHTFALTAEVEGKVVVTKSGNIARDVGLLPGMVVVMIDQIPVTDILNSIDESSYYGSTPRQRRMNAVAQLLSTPGQRIQVTVETASGQQKTVDLAWEDPSAWPRNTAHNVLPVSGERLPSGLGYLQIQTFRDNKDYDLVDEFDVVLDALMETPGLILDVRGNQGGSTLLSDRIAGRFFTAPFTYGREYYPTRLPIHGWRLWYDYTIRPRGDYYSGKLVVLTDLANVSTAEQFIVAMHDSGRAAVIGQASSGGSGNPTCFQLPDGAACFSTGDFRRASGEPIEGSGIQPDLPVDWTIDDIRASKDPVLRRAVEFLIDQLAG